MFLTQPSVDKQQALYAAMAAGQYRPDEIDLVLADECSQFYHDPLGWVMWAFDWGYGELADRAPDDWQIDILNEIGKGSRRNNFDGITPCLPQRIAVASGHGIGKSALTSWIILWIMSTRPYAKGTVTAMTADQLQTKTWAELSKWKARCLVGHWFELNSGKGSLSLYHKAFPETWLCKALTCREENSEAFAGQHAENSTSFYLFDEASGVPDKIYEVAEGGLTDGEPMFFAFGNPTRNVGEFKKCFNMNSGWITRNIDSRDCKIPNHEMHKIWIEKWGINSDFVRVRIRGLFPNADDTQFIASDVVRDARERDVGAYLGTDPLICGFDVARGGKDNCVLQFRRGKDAKSEKTYIITGEKSRDSTRLVSMVTNIFDSHMPDQIFVDETGIGGPILDRLIQLGYPALGVKFGGKADEERKYNNKTAEMGMRLREWLDTGGSIPDSEDLEAELICREFWHDANDRLVLEPKEQLKERLGVSPDWADALYLTFAYHVPALKIPRGMRDTSWRMRREAAGAQRDYDPVFQDEQNPSRGGDYDPLQGM